MLQNDSGNASPVNYFQQVIKERSKHLKNGFFYTIVPKLQFFLESINLIVEVKNSIVFSLKNLVLLSVRIRLHLVYIGNFSENIHFILTKSREFCYTTCEFFTDRQIFPGDRRLRNTGLRGAQNK